MTQSAAVQLGCGECRQARVATNSFAARRTEQAALALRRSDDRCGGQVNQLEEQAHAAVTGLMTGSGVDVHQAMIATQKASMAFELALAVRNKAVQAYQQVIGMQF
jgi:flagellar hook-basal body complex protein FliE